MTLRDLLRAGWSLVRITFFRQLRSKKVVICALLILGLTVVVCGIGYDMGRHAKGGAPTALDPGRGLRDFGDFVVLRMVGLFFLPAVALLLGAGALGDEKDEKTLPYLLTRPLTRWGIFVGKFLAVLPIALLFSVGGLALLHRAASVAGWPGLEGMLGVFVPAVALGSIAYLAFFHLLSAVFRHATLISIAYVFFIEVFVGRVPGILKRISISFYTWSMVYDAGAPYHIEPRARMVFLPVDGETAAWVLFAVTLVCLGLGALRFSRGEYHDAA